MSKINAIRFINMNYNNSTIRIDDETFHLNGESTLLSLRNGGGKSVLVQLLMAQFVHKRYRDSNGRKFSSYFDTNRPSFILVEWKLDDNAGYVLTGMMARKSQFINEEENRNDLDIFQFIHEYKDRNEYDIHRIGFLKSYEDKKVLMKFSDSKNLLEKLKLSPEYKFFLYDFNNDTQARNYFKKLEEYQIYYKEWESIVKKVNLKESGLSELFSKAKNESGLVENWFLPAVEDKLNKDKNKVEEFRNILDSYLKQYKDNKSKIDQKVTIDLFKVESEEILSIAKDLQSSEENRSKLENQIANLNVEINNYIEILKNDVKNLEDKKATISLQIESLKYEELSLKIYKLMDKLEKLTVEASKLDDGIKKAEEERQRQIRFRNIQYCSRTNEEYREASEDVQVLENKLNLLKDKEKDRGPERESLGYSLKYHYENELKLIEKSLLVTKDDLVKENEKNESLKREMAKTYENISLTREDLIKVKNEISNYDKLEEKFNRLYGENLRRNILNEYEEDKPETRLSNSKDLLESFKLSLVKEKDTRFKNDENLRVTRRNIQDKIADQASIKVKYEQIEKEMEAMNKEIENRKAMIKYISFTEDKVFNTKEILLEFQKRKDDVSRNIGSLERNKENLEEEYNKLKEGKLFQLPEEMKLALEAEGINYLYGMEWLRKNGKSFEENKKIIEANEFIPYGLILTSMDLDLLRANNLDIYTSIPIPIIIRENLERKYVDSENKFYMGNKVNFYVLFNNDLLDPVELSKILEKKEVEIKKIEENIEVRRSDLKRYEDISKIFFKELSEKDYIALKKEIESNIKLQSQIRVELFSLMEEEKSLEESQDKLEIIIKKLEKDIGILEQKSKDLFGLNLEYKSYLKSLDKGKENEKLLLKLEKRIQEISVERDNIREIIENIKKIEGDSLNKKNIFEEKIKKYFKYKENELIQKDIEDIEARYDALSSEISGELKEIEGDLKKAADRFKKKEKDLIEEAKRLNIREEEFINEIYSNSFLSYIENKIQILEMEINNLREKIGNVKTEISLKNQEIDIEYKYLKDLNKEDLLEKSEIIEIDFQKEIEDRKYQCEKIVKKFKIIMTKIGHLEGNISSLASYSNFILVNRLDFKEKIILMDKKALDNHIGSLLRDYRQINEEINDLKRKLEVALSEKLRKKAFEDAFFNKPLTTLFSLVDDPMEFINQLNTSIRAYDDLVKKLEVDIALIDEEKKRILEILLEYIADIHKNLSKIDKNSTIKIKEKSLKMLNIELPDWDSEELQYRNNLEGMLDDLTKSAMIRLEANENIDDLVGVTINTKNLYNSIVGINNINIKLYKIEAERQQKITWAEVSKNSGGEGFLSAFVILSSLLSFMRRNDSDIFSEREEGKVLLMDNPFAQTSSGHLLEPLMNVANKNNTQLISFTALGGEDIYASFDNIYVLNILPSNLKKGVSYLKSNHTRGESSDIMVSSQVRVEDPEQLNLLF